MAPIARRIAASAAMPLVVAAPAAVSQLAGPAQQGAFGPSPTDWRSRVGVAPPGRGGVAMRSPRLSHGLGSMVRSRGGGRQIGVTVGGAPPDGNGLRTGLRTGDGAVHRASARRGGRHAPRWAGRVWREAVGKRVTPPADIGNAGVGGCGGAPTPRAAATATPCTSGGGGGDANRQWVSRRHTAPPTVLLAASSRGVAAGAAVATPVIP